MSPDSGLLTLVGCMGQQEKLVGEEVLQEVVVGKELQGWTLVPLLQAA